MSKRNMCRTKTGHVVPRALFVVVEQPSGDLLDSSTEERTATEMKATYRDQGINAVLIAYVPRDREVKDE